MAQYTYTHACMHACMHTYIRTCIRTHILIENACGDHRRPLKYCCVFVAPGSHLGGLKAHLDALLGHSEDFWWPCRRHFGGLGCYRGDLSGYVGRIRLGKPKRWSICEIFGWFWRLWWRFEGFKFRSWKPSWGLLVPIWRPCLRFWVLCW